MVYYRKYRPQTISELDSAKLREMLTAVLSQKDVPHAFLLTGPKGLGKTSTARIIAKVVNCENRKPGSVEPCNHCEQCISITNGSNMDVLEIDGASNRGIDEIRDLRDKVKLAPSRAKKKVYIIDEVHMLTTEAFNALLKTIEEPPAHVMFLFATTEPQKVPATILSRCFHVAYTLATEDDLVHSFQRIVTGEKLAVDEDALHVVARMADGGFRDGTKILEELVLLANGQKITKEFVENHYHTSSISEHVYNFLEAILARNAQKAIGIIDDLVKQGVDMKYFVQELLEACHTALVGALGVETSGRKIAGLDMPTIQQLVTIFSEAYRETKYAVLPQLPLELAVVAWCSQKNLVIANEVKQSESGKEIASSQAPRNDNKQTMDSLLKKEKNLKVQAILRGTPDIKAPTESEDLKKKITQEEITDKAAAERLMDNLIFKVKPQNHSVAGVLRGCIVKALGNEQIVFETAFKFHKERLDEAKTKEILEIALKEITGKNLKVVVELKDK